MQKLNIGQRFILTGDMTVKGFDEETPQIIQKGTVLFAGADKKHPCYHMLNGKILLINKDEKEITDGYSVTGIAEWIYQHISATWNIDEMLENVADYEETSLAEQIKAFKQSIGEALEELGFYDFNGNSC